jgi:hypothetical protein
MTEQEAIAVLYKQFTTPHGFLPQLQRGEGLDRAGVQQVWQALDTLQQAWAQRPCVPREAVRALTYMDEALPATFDRNPTCKDELIDLYFEVFGRIEETFYPVSLPEEEDRWRAEEAAPIDGTQFPPDFDGTQLPPDFFWWEDWSDQTVVPDRPLTHEESLAVLRQHLAGGEGLIVALRCRWGAGNKLGMAKAWLLLSRALETLQPHWSEQPCIPKGIASGLAQIRGLIINGWTLYDAYPTIQQALLRVADDLGTQVQRCLQDRSPGSLMR